MIEEDTLLVSLPHATVLTDVRSDLSLSLCDQQERRDLCVFRITNTHWWRLLARGWWRWERHMVILPRSTVPYDVRSDLNLGLGNILNRGGWLLLSFQCRLVIRWLSALVFFGTREQSVHEWAVRVNTELCELVFFLINCWSSCHNQWHTHKKNRLPPLKTSQVNFSICLALQWLVVSERTLGLSLSLSWSLSMDVCLSLYVSIW